MSESSNLTVQLNFSGTMLFTPFIGLIDRDRLLELDRVKEIVIEYFQSELSSHSQTSNIQAVSTFGLPFDDVLNILYRNRDVPSEKVIFSIVDLNTLPDWVAYRTQFFPFQFSTLFTNISEQQNRYFKTLPQNILNELIIEVLTGKISSDNDLLKIVERILINNYSFIDFLLLVGHQISLNRIDYDEIELYKSLLMIKLEQKFELKIELRSTIVDIIFSSHGYQKFSLISILIGKYALHRPISNKKLGQKFYSLIDDLVSSSGSDIQISNPNELREFICEISKIFASNLLTMMSSQDFRLLTTEYKNWDELQNFLLNLRDVEEGKQTSLFMLLLFDTKTHFDLVKDYFKLVEKNAKVFKPNSSKIPKFISLGNQLEALDNIALHLLNLSYFAQLSSLLDKTKILKYLQDLEIEKIKDINLLNSILSNDFIGLFDHEKEFYTLLELLWSKGNLDDKNKIKITFGKVVKEIKIRFWKLYEKKIYNIYPLIISGDNESIWLPSSYFPKIKPYLRNINNVVTIVILIDGMRIDLFSKFKKTILDYPSLKNKSVFERTGIAIVPSITHHSRTAFFSGKLPIEFSNAFERRSNLYKDEKVALKKLLNPKNIKFITKSDEEITRHFSTIKKGTVLGLVFNSIDKIQHGSIDLNQNLGSLVDNIMRTQIFPLLQFLDNQNISYNIIVSSDHGYIGKKQSEGYNPHRIMNSLHFDGREIPRHARVLWRERNLFKDLRHSDLKNHHLIHNPREWGLPSKVDRYNDSQKLISYLILGKNSRLSNKGYPETGVHGGMTPEEMIIPFLLVSNEKCMNEDIKKLTREFNPKSHNTPLVRVRIEFSNNQILSSSILLNTEISWQKEDTPIFAEKLIFSFLLDGEKVSKVVRIYKKLDAKKSLKKKVVLYYDKLINGNILQKNINVDVTFIFLYLAELYSTPNKINQSIEIPLSIISKIEDDSISRSFDDILDEF